MTATATGISRPMIGWLNAVVIFVNGPGSASMSDGERNDTMKAIQTGLGHLTDLHETWRRAQQPVVRRACGFTPDSRRVTLPLDPKSIPAATEPAKGPEVDFLNMDMRWIDAALTELGYDSTAHPRLEDRIAALTQDTTLTNNVLGIPPSDTWVVLVTKYPCHWGAYAKPEYGFCTLCLPLIAQHEWARKIDLVLAHETGHIFGASDEYVDDAHACDRNERGGPYGQLNSNCSIGNPNSVKCLMKENDLVLCPFTPLQWGWQDSDHDGLVDLAAPPTITGISVFDPDLGLVPGGRAAAPGWQVMITGRNAGDARVVAFGGVPSDYFFPVENGKNDTVVAKVPDVSGIVTIDLTTRMGAANPSFEDAWFLVAKGVPLSVDQPMVLDVAPAAGGSGTQVTLHGAGLKGPTSIKFGNAEADLSTLPAVDDQDDDRVTVSAPAGPTGPVPVVVTTAQGSSQAWLGSTFTYPP